MAVTSTDPTTIAQRWSTNLGASGQKVTEGVNAVTVPPGQMAARAADLWLARLQAAKATWTKNVQVPLADWQSAMINKGVPRLATGATAAQPKFEQFMSKLLPQLRTVVSSLPPRGDIEANIARSAAFQRAMNKTKGSYR